MGRCSVVVCEHPALEKTHHPRDVFSASTFTDKQDQSAQFGSVARDVELCFAFATASISKLEYVPEKVVASICYSDQLIIRLLEPSVLASETPAAAFIWRLGEEGEGLVLVRYLYPPVSVS
jgi:hypothetical protein